MRTDGDAGLIDGTLLRSEVQLTHALPVGRRPEASRPPKPGRLRWIGAGIISNLLLMTSDGSAAADRRPLARAAAITAGVLLGAIGALHALWAAGSTWPFSDKARLAEVIWGGSASTFPSATATWAVVVMIGTAVALVTGQAGLWGAGVPRWVFWLGTWGVAAVLILRALLFGTAAIGSDAVNRTWELALFTPLCLVIGLLCMIVAAYGARSRSRKARASTADGL